MLLLKLLQHKTEHGLTTAALQSGLITVVVVVFVGVTAMCSYISGKIHIRLKRRVSGYVVLYALYGVAFAQKHKSRLRGNL